MIICPSNDAFLDAVRRACAALGRAEIPARSVAVVPQLGGRLSLKLVDVASNDPRKVVVLSETTVESADDVAAALGRIFLQGGSGDELLFLNEKSDQPNGLRRWVFLDLTTMTGAEIDGRVPQISYYPA